MNTISIKRRYKSLTMCAIATFMCAVTSLASASLINDVIHVEENSNPPGIDCTVGLDCNGQADTGFYALAVGAYSVYFEFATFQGADVTFSGLDFSGAGEWLTDVIITNVTGDFSNSGGPFISAKTTSSFTVSYGPNYVPNSESVTMALGTNLHSAVPEPATLALMGLGLAGLGFRRMKQA